MELISAPVTLRSGGTVRTTEKSTADFRPGVYGRLFCLEHTIKKDGKEKNNPMYHYIQIILVLSLLPCAGKAQEPAYNIYFDNQKIVSSDSKASIEIKPDTFFYNYRGEFLTYKSKKEEYESRLFFLQYGSGQNYKILEVDSLREDFLDFDIFGYDFDRNGVIETVAVWKEESTFYFSVYEWSENKARVRISKIFQSDDLGIPETGHGKKYEIANDMVIFYYQKSNGDHCKSRLIPEGKSFKLEEVK